jgi:PAS domain S-box-containing protein
LLAINSAGARMFGFDSPADAIATLQDNSSEVYAHPEDRLEIVKKLRENPNPQKFEVVFRRKNGSTFLGSLHVRMVHDEETQSQTYEGMVEDITGRKKWQRKPFGST